MNAAPENNAPTEVAEPRRRARTFRTAPPDWRPRDAIPAAGDRERAAMLYAWRDEVFRQFGQQARTVRVAWVLVDLAAKNGYAHASDGWLAKATKVASNHVNAALRALERAGLIAKRHVMNGTAIAERRVWLLQTEYPKTVYRDQPETGEKPYPKSGLQKLNTNPRSQGRRDNGRETATMRAARMAAEARARAEARKRGEDERRTDAGAPEGARAGGVRE
jgi:DNA-binding MarR family transcriptional regulator